MQQMYSVWLIMSNSYCTNGQWHYKRKPNCHNHCLKEITRVGFFWNAKMVPATSIHRKLNSHIHHKGKKKKKKNYDRIETRKKLALYENIKFYDYIP